MFKLIFEPRPHRLNALQSNLWGIFVSLCDKQRLFERKIIRERGLNKYENDSSYSGLRNPAGGNLLRM